MESALWRGVESAGVDEPQPLLVAADWFDDHDKSIVAHFLKWCAGKRRRPFKRTDVIRRPWTWFCWTQRSESEMGPKRFKHRQAAHLQYIFFDAMGPNDHNPVGFPTCAEAYMWGAESLNRLRSIVDAPNIVVPPQPQIIQAGPLTCPKCGLMRANTAPICPVCKDTA